MNMYVFEPYNDGVIEIDIVIAKHLTDAITTFIKNNYDDMVTSTYDSKTHYLNIEWRLFKDSKETTEHSYKIHIYENIKKNLNYHIEFGYA